MASGTRFLSEHIDRPARAVYGFTADPANLSRWAAGVGDDAEVVFHLRRSPGMTDEEWERDIATVAADLARLRAAPEQSGTA